MTTEEKREYILNMQKTNLPGAGLSKESLCNHLAWVRTLNDKSIEEVWRKGFGECWKRDVMDYSSPVFTVFYPNEFPISDRIMWFKERIPESWWILWNWSSCSVFNIGNITHEP